MKVEQIDQKLTDFLGRDTLKEFALSTEKTK